MVTKRYIDGKEGGAEREWRALTLLAEHAPGLAPAPIAFDGGVVMSRVDGVPLRGMAAAAVHAGALVEAVSTMHAAVPRAVLDQVPVRPWQVGMLGRQVRQWCESWLATRADREGGAVAGDQGDRAAVSAQADRAVGEGLRWLDSWRPGEVGVTPAFGAGDGNLANFLWDGTRVRILDFEDSGRSDRAFELAELAEHVSMWVDGEVNVLRHAELSSAEAARLRECRRLQALTWLFLLSGEGPRNPPGTFARQVERVLARLEG
ncbi:phosphotransferase [Nonomuraea sp. NPDC046570]|uniref:phosphotransferase n=1 Tax=Nonomuraea sp. NPDC046570 TaxID=3155255 RepID=UPI0033CD25ED